MLPKQSTCIERLYNRDSVALDLRRSSYQVEIPNVPSAKPDVVRRRWPNVNMARHLNKLRGKNVKQNRPGSSQSRHKASSSGNRDGLRPFNINARFTGTCVFVDSDEDYGKSKPGAVLKSKGLQSESNKIRRVLKKNTKGELDTRNTDEKRTSASADKGLTKEDSRKQSSVEENYDTVCRDMDEILYTLCEKYSQLKKYHKVSSMNKSVPPLPNGGCVCGGHRLYADNVTARIRRRYNLLNRSHFSNFNRVDSNDKAQALRQGTEQTGLYEGNDADKGWGSKYPEKSREKESSESNQSTPDSNSLTSKDNEKSTYLEQDNKVPNTFVSHPENTQEKEDKIDMLGDSGSRDSDLQNSNGITDGITIQKHDRHRVTLDDTLVTLDSQSAFTVVLGKENQRVEKLSDSSETGSVRDNDRSYCSCKITVEANKTNRRNCDVFYEVKAVDGSYLVTPRRCSDYDAVLWSLLKARPDQQTTEEALGKRMEPRHSGHSKLKGNLEEGKLGNGLEEIEFKPTRNDGRRVLPTLNVKTSSSELSKVTVTNKFVVETPEKSLEENSEPQLKDGGIRRPSTLYIKPTSSDELLRLTEIYHSVVETREKILKENSEPKPKEMYDGRRSLSNSMEPINTGELSKVTVPKGNGFELRENEKNISNGNSEFRANEKYNGRSKRSTLYIDPINSSDLSRVKDSKEIGVETQASLEEHFNFQPKEKYDGRRRLSTLYIDPINSNEPPRVTDSKEIGVESHSSLEEHFNFQPKETYDGRRRLSTLYIDPINSNEPPRVTDSKRIGVETRASLEENSNFQPREKYDRRRRISTLYIDPIHSCELPRVTEVGVDTGTSLEENSSFQPKENHDGRRRPSTFYKEPIGENCLQESSGFQPKERHYERRKLSNISDESNVLERKESLNGETSVRFENMKKQTQPTEENFKILRYAENDFEPNLTGIKENQVAEEIKSTPEKLVLSKNEENMDPALSKNSNFNKEWVKYKSIQATLEKPEKFSEAEKTTYFKSGGRNDKITQIPVREDKSALVGESLNNLVPGLKVTFDKLPPKKVKTLSDKRRNTLYAVTEAESERNMKYPTRDFGFRRDTSRPLIRAVKENEAKVTDSQETRDPVRMSTEAKKKKSFLRCIKAMKRRFSKNKV